MNHCLFCDEAITDKISWREVFGLKQEGVLCGSCRASLGRIEGELCRICGRSLDRLNENLRNGELCRDCQLWESGAFAGVLDKNRSLYHYNAFLQDIIARYKFRGDVALAQGFCDDWRKIYQAHYDGRPVVPIPLSRERLYERGFNQAAVLADLLPASCYEVLERPLHEPKQSQKSRMDRLRLRADQFRSASDIADIEGADVVLVDDIYTTGATLHQAARVLLAAGANSVSAMTLARG